MSARAVALPSGSRTNTAPEAERTAEQLPAMSPVRRTGWRRWLEEDEGTCGKRALIPAHICCHILNVYSWVAGCFGIISGAVYFAHDPAAAAADASYWGFVAMSAVQLVIAVLRGWPFGLRYSILAAT